MYDVTNELCTCNNDETYFIGRKNKLNKYKKLIITLYRLIAITEKKLLAITFIMITKKETVPK